MPQEKYFDNPYGHNRQDRCKGKTSTNYLAPPKDSLIWAMETTSTKMTESMTATTPPKTI